MSDHPENGLLGLAAATCAACCAGPVLAFLGGVTVAGIVGTAFVGILAATVAVVVVVAFLVIRRRRAVTACVAGPKGDGPVPVAAPVRRPGEERGRA